MKEAETKRLVSKEIKIDIFWYHLFLHLKCSLNILPPEATTVPEASKPGVAGSFLTDE